MDIQGFEPYAIKAGRELFKKHNVTMLYMEWAEMRNALKKPSIQSDVYVALVEDAISFLVTDLKFEVYSKETNSRLYYKDRKQWTDNVFLVQPGFKFHVTAEFPEKQTRNY